MIYRLTNSAFSLEYENPLTASTGWIMFKYNQPEMSEKAQKEKKMREKSPFMQIVWKRKIFFQLSVCGGKYLWILQAVRAENKNPFMLKVELLNPSFSHLFESQSFFSRLSWTCACVYGWKILKRIFPRVISIGIRY